MSIKDDHDREQAEAAVAEACRILELYSKNYIIYVRVAPYTYARQISGRTNTERIQLAHGVSQDLSEYVAKVAQIASEMTDCED